MKEGKAPSKRLPRAMTVRGMYVQAFCSKTICRCVGRPTRGMECNCLYVGFARCLNCGAPMHKIGMDEGEPVLEHCLDLS